MRWTEARAWPRAAPTPRTSSSVHMFEAAGPSAGATGRPGPSPTCLASSWLAQPPPLEAKRSGGRKDNWTGCIDEVLLAPQDEAPRLQAPTKPSRATRWVRLLVASRPSIDADRPPNNRRREGPSSSTTCWCGPATGPRARPEVPGAPTPTTTALLIDEFQDTDPIQVELAVRGRRRSEGRAALDDARRRAGRLFFVGDPKQAIYRFRRADIGLFLPSATASAAAPSISPPTSGRFPASSTG